MAKEEQTTVGLNKSTIAMVLLVFAIIGYAAFWKDRGGSEAKAEANHYSIVGSHEIRLTKVESGLVRVVERQTSIEKTQIALHKDQQALLKGQDEMKLQRKEDAKLLRDQRSEDMKFRSAQQKTIAELNAYLRTIDKIE